MPDEQPLTGSVAALSGAPMGGPSPASMTTQPEQPEMADTATAGMSGTAPSVGSSAITTPPKPHVSVARHVLDALGGSNPNDPMGWAKSTIAGALAGAANVGEAPVGGGFLFGLSKGAQGAMAQQRQADLDKQKIKQQQFENQEKQKADERAKQELQNSTDRTKSEVALTTAQTLASIQTRQQNAARFGDLQKEDQLKVRQLDDQIHDSEANDLSILSSAGVDITKLEHVTSSDQLTDSHAKQAGSGAIFPVSNGERHEAGEDKAGAYVVPSSVWDQPIKADTKVISGWDIDAKTGKPTPKYTDAVAGTKVGTLLAITRGARMDLENKQKQIMDQASIEQKHAETFKAGQEGKKAGAEAAAMGSAPIQDQAKMLVEGDMDPSQLSKRAGSYGATLAAANAYSMQKFGKPFDVAQASADYTFAKNTGTQNTLKYLNSLTGADNKSGNLGELIRQSDHLTRTQFPALNDAAAWARLQSGDPAMASYHATVSEVADQVAKILQGGGGGATSDAKMKQAQDLFNSGFNKDQIRSTAETLRTLLGNRKSELVGTNRYLQRQYEGEQKAAAQPGAANANDPFSQFGGKLR